MKERPILFSGPMVKALLAGTKTQTRRIVRLPNGVDYDGYSGSVVRGSLPFESTGTRSYTCPYGAPGDRLWVRESAWIWCDRVAVGRTKTGRIKVLYHPINRAGSVVYCTDGATKPTHPLDDDLHHMWRFKIGRFMPRWASRIALEVTGVRVERLQAITAEDAKAEGVTVPRCSCEACSHTSAICPADATSYVEGFRDLWCKINGPESWQSNPWVWVVSFRKVES